MNENEYCEIYEDWSLYEAGKDETVFWFDDYHGLLSRVMVDPEDLFLLRRQKIAYQRSKKRFIVVGTYINVMSQLIEKPDDGKEYDLVQIKHHDNSYSLRKQDWAYRPRSERKSGSKGMKRTKQNEGLPKGISFKERLNCFDVNIWNKHKKKTEYVGRYDSTGKAVAAYKKAYWRIHGKKYEESAIHYYSPFLEPGEYTCIVKGVNAILTAPLAGGIRIVYCCASTGKCAVKDIHPKALTKWSSWIKIARVAQRNKLLVDIEIKQGEHRDLVKSQDFHTDTYMKGLDKRKQVEIKSLIKQLKEKMTTTAAPGTAKIVPMIPEGESELVDAIRRGTRRSSA